MMQRLSIFVLALCMNLAFIAESEAQQSAKKLVKDAQTYYQAGEYNKALTALNSAIELEAGHEQAVFWRGKTQKELKNYKAALSDLSAASTAMPKNAEVLQELAQAQLLAGNRAAAIETYDRLLTIQPKSLDTYHKKAQIQLQLKDFDAVMKTAMVAQGVNKNDDLSYYYIAQAADSLGNTALAETNYAKALALIRENKSKKEAVTLHKPYYLGLANAQRKQFKNDDAFTNYSELIRIDPYDHQAYIYRGAVRAARLEFQDALQDLNQSIALFPKNPEAFYQRGLINKKLGQYPAALNDFNQANQFNGENATLIAERASCYYAMGQYNEAVRDYKKAHTMQPANANLLKTYTEAREKQYEANKESDPPRLQIVQPRGITSEITIRKDAASVTLDAQVTDASAIRSVVAGGKTVPVKDDELNPAFTVTIPIAGKEHIDIQVTDVYLNTALFTYQLKKTEVDPPVVNLSRPLQSNENNLLFIENKPMLMIEGKIKDESLIKSIIINGTSASFPLDMKNPVFQAMVEVGTGDSLHVRVADMVGNESVTRYKLVREDTTGANPMGTTWVVFIENTNYQNLQRLEGPARDVADMKSALANYKIDNVIHKKDLSKMQLDKFFSIELRDQIQKNRVKSLIVWYAGHGKFLNETGYWIPVDGDSYEEHSYYSVNSLRAAMESYTMLKHLLVISDACESGPAFYMAMRDDQLTPRTCEDWEVTRFRSAQVMTSSNKELSNDNSLFTQAFANTLNNNPNSCIPIEWVAGKISGIVKQNQRQTPKFGKIKGLTDENGTFFFIKKDY